MAKRKDPSKKPIEQFAVGVQATGIRYQEKLPEGPRERFKKFIAECFSLEFKLAGPIQLANSVGRHPFFQSPKVNFLVGN